MFPINNSNPKICKECRRSFFKKDNETTTNADYDNLCEKCFKRKFSSL